jgi:hypothetical protein
MCTAKLKCSNDRVAWAQRALWYRRNLSRIDDLRAKFHPLARLREIFSLISRFNAAFVNKTSESVTLTWIESEGRSVQMSGEQELVLA